MDVNDELPRAEFGFPGALRDRLVAAILAGSKTSTTSIVAEYLIEEEPFPRAGERHVVIDSSGTAVAVIETTSVEQTQLGAVPWEHARDEGEGYDSLEEWRLEHERYWHSAEMRNHLGDPAFTVNDRTLVVLERFRLVETDSAHT